MEFKLKLNKKKKAAAERAKKEKGYKKVKIRGRKRWVKAEKK